MLDCSIKSGGFNLWKTTRLTHRNLMLKILDTVHLKNLVEDLARLYGTSVNTKVAKDSKVAAERRLIEAIRANLDRYNG